jgi:hypothetical protein
MKKFLIYLIVILLLGGGIYYIMDYNSESPKDNDIFNSTKEFATDVVKKSKSMIDSSETLHKVRDKLKD